METIAEIKEKKKQLEAQKRALCEASTSQVKSELAKIEKVLAEKKKEASVKYTKEWVKMSEIVADIFKMGFQLYTIKGIDLKLELSNHVQWLSCDTGDEYAYNYRFAAYERGEFGELIPLYSELEELHEFVKETYTTEFGE